MVWQLVALAATSYEYGKRRERREEGERARGEKPIKVIVFRQHTMAKEPPAFLISAKCYFHSSLPSYFFLPAVIVLPKGVENKLEARKRRKRGEEGNNNSTIRGDRACLSFPPFPPPFPGAIRNDTSVRRRRKVSAPCHPELPASFCKERKGISGREDDKVHGAVRRGAVQCQGLQNAN